MGSPGARPLRPRAALRRVRAPRDRLDLRAELRPDGRPAAHVQHLRGDPARRALAGVHPRRAPRCRRPAHAPPGGGVPLRADGAVAPGGARASTGCTSRCCSWRWSRPSRARGGGFRLPALALGLVWCLATPFFYAGGLDDFRFDFAGWCLYGTFLSLVMRSEMFRRHGWALAAGAVATAVRAHALADLGLPGRRDDRLDRRPSPGGCGAHRDDAARADRQRQLVGAVLCAACLVLVALPSLALRARSLWNYYVVGHVTGAESAVRKAESGITGSLDALAYYPALALRRPRRAGVPVDRVRGAGAARALPEAARGALARPAGFPPEAGWFAALCRRGPAGGAHRRRGEIGHRRRHPGGAAPVGASCSRRAALARRARPEALAGRGGGRAGRGRRSSRSCTSRAALRAASTGPRSVEVSRLHDDVVRVVRERGFRQPQPAGRPQGRLRPRHVRGGLRAARRRARHPLPDGGDRLGADGREVDGGARAERSHDRDHGAATAALDLSVRPDARGPAAAAARVLRGADGARRDLPRARGGPAVRPGRAALADASPD